jgi:hypothetical protein
LDTAKEDDGWTLEYLSPGQSGVTSLVVDDIFGGKLMAADDLTREQFRSGDVTRGADGTATAGALRPRTPPVPPLRGCMRRRFSCKRAQRMAIDKRSGRNA